MPEKELDEKAFEQALKGKMGWKCSCSLEIIDKESTLKTVQCKNCGKTFKANQNAELCFDCEKKKN